MFFKEQQLFLSPLPSVRGFDGRFQTSGVSPHKPHADLSLGLGIHLAPEAKADSSSQHEFWGKRSLSSG